jgi:hypothetical protein
MLVQFFRRVDGPTQTPVMAGDRKPSQQVLSISKQEEDGDIGSGSKKRGAGSLSC